MGEHACKLKAFEADEVTVVSVLYLCAQSGLLDVGGGCT